jgi:hypothetical protein
MSAKGYTEADARAGAVDLANKFEALVGPLPVSGKPIGGTRVVVGPDTVRAYVVRGDIGQSIDMKLDGITEALTKIIGGSFHSVVWENTGAASGLGRTDIMQLIPHKGEGPDVWLRADPKRRGKPIKGRTMKLAGRQMPLEEFDPAAVLSLRDEDLMIIDREFYTRGEPEARSPREAAEDHFRDHLRSNKAGDRAAQRPKDTSRQCTVSGCTEHPAMYHTYCDAHVNERAESMPEGQFIRLLARPEEQKKPPPPCYRCGKFGGRYRYLVRIQSKQRDVCMDCADEIGASEVFETKTKTSTAEPSPYPTPSPMMRMKTPEDDTPALRRLHKWRLERYLEFQGVDPHDPKSAIEINLNLTSLGGAAKEYEGDSSSARTVLDSQLSGRPFHERVVIDVPLRVMVGHKQQCRIAYIPRESALEAINEIIGAPTAWIFTKPDLIVFRHSDPVQAGRFPLVMLCGEIQEDYKDLDELPPAAAFAPRDLTDKAEEKFRKMFGQALQEANRIVGEVDKDTHKAIILTFLKLMEVVRLGAIGNDAATKRIWPKLRDAVIFEMPPIAYETLFEQFARYCIRSAGLDPDAIDEHTEKERQRAMKFIESGIDAPFPDKLPFESCFFAYGGGVEIPTILGAPEGGTANILYGHLVCADGTVSSFRRFRGQDNGQQKEGVSILHDRENGKWQNVHSLSPWIVNALIAYINEHQTLIETGKRGLGYKTLLKRSAKKLGVKVPRIPPPFYVVYIRDQLIREQVQQQSHAIKRHIDWQHRWRVRGSWCIRFERGPLPLDPEKEAELRKRKYKIFTVTQPDAELFSALVKRGIPGKRTDEWLAILKYWRGEHIKGPEDKPLIESVRRSTKKWKVPTDESPGEHR